MRALFIRIVLITAGCLFMLHAGSGQASADTKATADSLTSPLPSAAHEVYADPGETSPTTIKVQVDDHLVSFADAPPLLDSRQQLLVPLRSVTDGLGMPLIWSMNAPAQVNVSLKQAGTLIELTTGSPEARVNGSPVAIGGEALFLDGRVYVPLRFIADTLHIRIQWDNLDRVVILDHDGRYHAPAWYASPPQPKTLDVVATAYSDSPSENGKWGAYDTEGDPLQLGTIAVDPSIIPLGTKVKITGYASYDLPANGLIAVAKDTGSAIQGNRIDIYMPGPRQKALNFGVQQVKLTILSP